MLSACRVIHALPPVALRKHPLLHHHITIGIMSLSVSYHYRYCIATCIISLSLSYHYRYHIPIGITSLSVSHHYRYHIAIGIKSLSKSYHYRYYITIGITSLSVSYHYLCGRCCNPNSVCWTKSRLLFHLDIFPCQVLY